jgi:hypothetical protein
MNPQKSDSLRKTLDELRTLRRRAITHPFRGRWGDISRQEIRCFGHRLSVRGEVFEHRRETVILYRLDLDVPTRNCYSHAATTFHIGFASLYYSRFHK